MILMNELVVIFVLAASDCTAEYLQLCEKCILQTVYRMKLKMSSSC